MFSCCVATTEDSAEVVKAEASAQEEPVVVPPIEPKEEVPAPAPEEPKVEEAPVKVVPEPEPPAPEPEAPAGLQFGFLSDEGVKYIDFPCKPVGMTFEKRMPIVVTGCKDGGEAERLGIQKGWEIKSIGGESLEKCTNYEEAMQLIAKHLKNLPGKK